MRVAMIVVGVAVVAIVIVKVLGSTLGAADHPRLDRGITGGLALDSVSRALQDTKLWKEPRYTHTRKDREEMYVGRLETGDEFRVLNHAGEGPTLWVLVEVRDRKLRGWLRSTPDDPFKSSKID